MKTTDIVAAKQDADGHLLCIVCQAVNPVKIEVFGNGRKMDIYCCYECLEKGDFRRWLYSEQEPTPRP